MYATAARSNHQLETSLYDQGSGTSSTGKFFMSLEAHQIATIRAVRREIEGRHEPLTLTKQYSQP